VEPPILTLRLDDEEILAVRAGEAPVALNPDIQLTRPGEVLHFVDSRGDSHSYDLSSLYDEGWRFVHLSVRVGPTFAVQPDALLTRDGGDPDGAFARHEGRGVRLQPFTLPESGVPAEPPGGGLFRRGLHYPGLITNGGVSLLCICDHCRKTFRLQSFHAGFSDLVYLYCSRGLHTLVASSYLPDAPTLLRPADPESVARFEGRLPPCGECGGEFRYLNPLRCPHCKEPYIDFANHPGVREQEYYGNYLYGGTLQRWEPPQEPHPGA
jgi:hypothetical protein